MTLASVPPEVAAAIGISYRMILDKEGRREVCFQTHVPQDVPDRRMNSLLDFLCTAVDRQVARAELAQLVKDSAAEMHQVSIFEARLAELDADSQARWEESGKRGPWDPQKLSVNERQLRENTKRGLENNRQNVRSMRARIEELAQVVTGDGTASATDRYAGLPNSQGTGNGLAGGAEA